jgi:hypothetical protein
MSAWTMMLRPKQKQRRTLPWKQKEKEDEPEEEENQDREAEAAVLLEVRLLKPLGLQIDFMKSDQRPRKKSF